MNDGDRVIARPKQIEESGLFADHNGDEIVVLITDWSWDQPLPSFSVSDDVGVVIMRFVPEKNQYRGSIREYENPVNS